MSRIGASVPPFIGNATADKITEQTGFEKAGLVVTMFALWKWVISSKNYTNANDVEIEIPLAAAGKNRIDLIVATKQNTFIRVPGVETEGDPAAEAVPTGTILATFVTVDDTTVSEPVVLPTGDLYLRKADENSKNYVIDALIDNQIPFENNTKAVLTGAGITEIIGFSGNLLLLTPFIGRTFVVTNRTSNNIIFRQEHEDAQFQLRLIGNTDYTLQPFETIYFYQQNKGAIQTTFNPLGGEVKLPAYNSSRIDTHLASHRTLMVDDDGNLKACVTAMSPGPFLTDLIPDSYLPDNTGNISIIGDFFIESMCDRINYPNAIILQGQTINYATFVNSQLILLNVTTSSIEGNYSLTLNNGIEKVFPNALLIVSGIVTKPTAADWEAITGQIDLTDDGEAKVQVFNSWGSARWSFPFDHTVDYRINWNYAKTPLGYARTNNEAFEAQISLRKASDDTLWFWVDVVKSEVQLVSIFVYDISVGYGQPNIIFYNTLPTSEENFDVLTSKNISFRKIGTTMYLYFNNTIVFTFGQPINEDLKLRTRIKSYDVINIKHIELL